MNINTVTTSVMPRFLQFLKKAEVKPKINNNQWYCFLQKQGEKSKPHKYRGSKNKRESIIISKKRLYYNYLLVVPVKTRTASPPLNLIDMVHVIIPKRGEQ